MSKSAQLSTDAAALNLTLRASAPNLVLERRAEKLESHKRKQEAGRRLDRSSPAAVARPEAVKHSEGIW